MSSELIVKCLEVFLTSELLIISSLTPKVSHFQSLDSERLSICPITEYNIFSRIFMLWLFKILKMGYKGTIDLSPYLDQFVRLYDHKYSYKIFEFANKRYNTNRKKTISLFPLICWTAWAPYSVASLLGSVPNGSLILFSPTFSQN